jgi:hypothetical protein
MLTTGTVCPCNRKPAVTPPHSLLARLITFLCLLVAAPLAAQTQIDAPEGPWLHAPTGTRFPQTMMGFQRDAITQFDDAGSNIGVSYSAEIGKELLMADVFIYPQYPGVSCAQVFGSVKAAIRYPGIKLLSEGMALPPGGYGEPTAHHARYFFPAGAMREGFPPLVSDAYLFCSADGKWLVKYRASWTGAAETFPDLAPFLKAFGWSASLGGAS